MGQLMPLSTNFSPKTKRLLMVCLDNFYKFVLYAFLVNSGLSRCVSLVPSALIQIFVKRLK
jgi:hypothetical protein